MLRLARLRVSSHARLAVATGAAAVAPFAFYGLDSQLARCEQPPPTTRRKLVKQLTHNYGNYGTSFIALLDRAESVHYDEGDYFFQRGDHATHLYLVMSGEAHLIAHEKSGESHQIDTLSAGSICGENALLEKNEARSRTIVAHTPCEVLRIERAAFEEALRTTNPHIRIDGANASGSRILAFINMVCPTEPRRATRGEVIFKQGDHTLCKFYIVNSGQLDIIGKDRYGREMKIDTINAGECFGYVAMLSPDLHAEKSYTIRCTSKEADLVVVNGDDFHRLVLHSRVVSTLMKNLTGLAKQHAKEAQYHKGASQFRGW